MIYVIKVHVVRMRNIMDDKEYCGVRFNHLNCLQALYRRINSDVVENSSVYGKGF